MADLLVYTKPEMYRVLYTEKDNSNAEICDLNLKSTFI